MKRYIYILLAGTLAALAGCIHDTPYEGPQVPSDGTVSLKITLPPPVAKTLGGGSTRAVDDFDVLNDVNIVIASGEGDAAQILSTTWFTLASPSLPTGVQYSAEENGFGVHFPREWFETYDIPSETIVFFVVGNYGSQVDAATVGDLRGLQVVSDVPLTHGSAQGHGCHGIVGIQTGKFGHGGLNHADLRPVAVRDGNLVFLFGQVGDGGCRPLYVGLLFGERLAKTGASQSYYNTFIHDGLPRFCI